MTTTLRLAKVNVCGAYIACYDPETRRDILCANFPKGSGDAVWTRWHARVDTKLAKLGWRIARTDDGKLVLG